MAIKYVKVKVVRSEMHQVVSNFPAWEIDILESIHQAVERLGDIIVNQDPPDAEDEYERLKNRYGRSENDDGSKGIPNVATVFGQGNVGINNLRAAIAKATVEDAREDASDLLGSVA